MSLSVTGRHGVRHATGPESPERVPVAVRDSSLHEDVRLLCKEDRPSTSQYPRSSSPFRADSPTLVPKGRHQQGRRGQKYLIALLPLTPC